MTFCDHEASECLAVGRTGSGKVIADFSTGLSADEIDRMNGPPLRSLLRCLFTEGEVYYDGILTSSIECEVLRSSLTILPQSVRFLLFSKRCSTRPHRRQAELLNGTIRQNLDPFGHFEDATLHDALRAAGVSELQAFAQEGDTPRLTLDTAGGANLSIGQRQIVALARAMVRESKLVVLDEGTCSGLPCRVGVSLMSMAILRAHVYALATRQRRLP